MDPDRELSLPARKPRSYPSIASSVFGIIYANVRDKYILGIELGRGGFGIIRLCVEKSSGKSFACKSVSKSKLETAEDVDDLRREVEVMKLLRGNPSVIHLETVVEDHKKCHIIMEACRGGELFERIKECGRYSESNAAQVAQQLAAFVALCQRKGLVHRDIKPENILLKSVASDSTIKVVDYGFASFIQPEERLSCKVGSAYYIAPEVLDGSYGKEADMWSVGVVIYIMLCGLPPFWHPTDEGIFDAILSGEYDLEGGPWRRISGEAKDLVRKILVQDPGARLTPQEVLAHPWIQRYSLDLSPCLSPPARVPESLASAHASYRHLYVNKEDPIVPEYNHCPPRLESIESEVSEYSPQGSRRWTGNDYVSSPDPMSDALEGMSLRSESLPLDSPYVGDVRRRSMETEARWKEGRAMRGSPPPPPDAMGRSRRRSTESEGRGEEENLMWTSMVNEVMSPARMGGSEMSPNMSPMMSPSQPQRPKPTRSLWSRMRSGAEARMRKQALHKVGGEGGGVDGVSTLS